MDLIVLVHDHFHHVIAGEAELIERELGRMRSCPSQSGADHLQRHVRHPPRKMRRRRPIESIFIESIFDLGAQGEKEATYRRGAVSEFTHE